MATLRRQLTCSVSLLCLCLSQALHELRLLAPKPWLCYLLVGLPYMEVHATAVSLSSLICKMGVLTVPSLPELLGVNTIM